MVNVKMPRGGTVPAPDPYADDPFVMHSEAAPVMGEPLVVRAESGRFHETGVSEPSVPELQSAAYRAALEEEYGAEPLELIHAKLAATEDEWARGWARFGPGNVSERRVKSLLCLYAMEYRDQAREAGEKVTEALIEQKANADVRLRAVLDEIDTARARWAVLDEQRERLKERVMRGQGLLRSLRVTQPGA